MLIFEGYFVLKRTVGDFDDVTLMINEALVGCVVFRARMRPRITIGRNEVASMKRQGIVEFVSSIDYELLEANADANPSFQLLYAEPHLYVPSSSSGRLKQGESLAIAAARLLRSDTAVDFNGR